jgi:DNA invertase Pin-like site-specific DNA recombinase
MSQAMPRRAAIYARVSTTDQTAENQLLALRDFAQARGWAVTEFVDSGVSGANTTTPSGRLLFHVLASVAEFERDLIRDRVHAGLRRARAQGKRLGPLRVEVDLPRARALLAEGQSLRAVSKIMGIKLATLHRYVSTTKRALAAPLLSLPVVDVRWTREVRGNRGDDGVAALAGDCARHSGRAH